MMRRDHIFATALVGMTSLLLLVTGSCTSGDESNLPSSEDTAGSSAIDTTDAGAGADADDADAEETALKDYGGWLPIERSFEELPLTDLPSCGLGCRIVLGDIVSHPAEYWSSVTSSLISDSNFGRIMFFDPLKPTTSWAVAWTVNVGNLGLLKDTDSELGRSFLGPYAHGQRIAFHRVMGSKRGRVQVIDVSLGKMRTFLEYTRVPSIADYGVLSVVLNDTYVFWMRDGHPNGGLYRASLESGEITRLTSRPDECDRIYATSNGVVCGSVYTGLVLFIDQDTGKETPLDFGGALQVDLAASPDRTQFVWLDYRDPPGQQSTYEGYRNGGEIYLHDVTTGKTSRLTFDSDHEPIGKIRPSVDGDTVIWMEPCGSCDKNPSVVTNLNANNVLVRLNRSTGERCRLDKPPIQSRFSVRGRQVFGYWEDHLVPSNFRLAALDLDTPGLAWSCQ